MPRKTIFVRERDLPLWEWAREFAERNRTTISGVLMNALEAYKAELEGRADDDGPPPATAQRG